MVRKIEIPGDQIEVRGDTLEVHANIGAGRVLSATVSIEDAIEVPVSDPAKMPFEEWERNFDEMCALAPLNKTPADVSREAMYLSDEELGNKQE